MNLSADESAAIRSKSLSLVDKLSDTLRRIDQWQFPTAASEAARGLLLDALTLLGQTEVLEPVSPAVLYNRLFSLQSLVEVLEHSATHRISWPLVSYCDAIWRRLFGESGPQIFYALTPVHNYSIVSFSQMLANDLRGLLPKTTIDDLLANRDLYCLRLSSSEDENSPLYANIGHEFGHAVFWQRNTEIVRVLDEHCGDLLDGLTSDIKSTVEAAQVERLFRRAAHVLLKVAAELFCDLIGTLLMGPAFLLSLFEISWGQRKDNWSVRLAPDDQYIEAYPSFSFRLHCIASNVHVQRFILDTEKDFADLPQAEIRDLGKSLKTIPVGHGNDFVSVQPDSDKDAQLIRTLLQGRLEELKPALESFIGQCASSLPLWYPLEMPCVSAHDVAALLRRLLHDVPPNVIPDGSLLGRPASFTAVLNASALFRLHLLANSSTLGAEELARRTGVVKRLTAKAFEVTFIQREFREWEARSG